MTVPRLFAIIIILLVAGVGWAILGTSVEVRTHSSDSELRARVGGLWGKPQAQRAPSFTRHDGTREAAVPLAGSDVRADIHLEQRRKGLLWYPTYRVGFSGAYRVSNTSDRPADVVMTFPLPAADDADYDGFRVRAGAADVAATFGDGRAVARFRVPPKSDAPVTVAYRTQGLDSWSYAPSPGGAAQVRDFTLTMTTDFAAVDFPDGAVSPTSKRPAGAGWELVWRYDSLVSGRAIALAMPKPLNPGPVASRISFFAPVSLIFFFASLVLLTATRRIRLHPMNYAFLASGFFAFDLLFAYLVDQVDITVAFAIAAATSMLLCIGYLRLVIGKSPAVIEAAIGQFLFLVLFSYSFFFEGFTGLTITIGAVVTLAYFMARTGRTDWDDVFARRQTSPYPQPPVAPPTPGPPTAFEPFSGS